MNGTDGLAAGNEQSSMGGKQSAPGSAQVPGGSAIKFLTLLLVVQVALAVVLKLSEIKYQPVEPTAPLLTCDFPKITNVVIEESQNEGKSKSKVVLQKVPGGWQIPGYFGVPASSDRIDQLLTTLKDLKKGFPISTTTGADEHYKVGADNFERSISLTDDHQKVTTLYVGTAPVFKLVYAKLPDRNEIYTVKLIPFQLDGKQNDWVDHSIIALQAGNIKSVDMGSFKLQKTDNKWTLTSPGSQSKTGTLHDTVAQNLLDAVSHVTFNMVLGTKPDPTYNMENPVLAFKVALNKGDDVTYTFSKPKDKPYYVLKVSSQPWYLSVDEWAFLMLKSMTPDALFRSEAQAISEEARSKKMADTNAPGPLKANGSSGSSDASKKTERAGATDVSKTKETSGTTDASKKSAPEAKATP